MNCGLYKLLFLSKWWKGIQERLKGLKFKFDYWYTGLYKLFIFPGLSNLSSRFQIRYLYMKIYQKDHIFSFINKNGNI